VDCSFSIIAGSFDLSAFVPFFNTLLRLVLNDHVPTVKSQTTASPAAKM
jgi:hypothetical protein